PSLFPSLHAPVAGAAGRKEKERERDRRAQIPGAPRAKTREKSFAATPCQEKGFQQSFTSLFAAPMAPSGQSPVRGLGPGFVPTGCQAANPLSLGEKLKPVPHFFRVKLWSDPDPSSGHKFAPLRPKRPGIFCIRLEEYLRFSHDLPHPEVEKETCTSRS